MKPATNVDRIAIELGHAGRNAIPYIDDDRNADRPFAADLPPLWLHADRPVDRSTALRNGDEYRDFWPAADKHKLLIVALTFSNEIWPGVESYNNGRVFSAGGNPRHIDGWTYALVGRGARPDRRRDHRWPERVPVRPFRRRQFVHRLMSSQSHAPFKAAGNPGWYTLPTFDHPSPKAWLASA